MQDRERAAIHRPRRGPVEFPAQPDLLQQLLRKGKRPVKSLDLRDAVGDFRVHLRHAFSLVPRDAATLAD